MITIDRAKNGYIVRENDIFTSPEMQQQMPMVFETFDNLVDWLGESIGAWQDGDERQRATTSA